MNLACSIALAAITFADASPRGDVIVVVGAARTPQYAADFTQAAELWRVASEQGRAAVETIGATQAATSDKETLRGALERLVPAEDRGPLWIVLLGHGTFSANVAKFNLRGPDVSAAEIAEWVASAKRPLAIINCASASGPFINALSGENRVVISATKSGDETNYARFGKYLAQAIGDANADLDKDGQVSLLEGFLIGSGRVAEFYREDARLATEHALLDDNGDKLGTPGDWFSGVRATKRSKDGAALDGLRAHQLILVPSASERELPAELRKRRDELEVAIEALREEKAKLSEDDYYAKLEPLMLELAKIYAASLEPETSAPGANP